MRRAKLPTLYTRRLQAITIIMYKVKNDLAPPYIMDLFVVTSSQYHLRSHDFVIPRFRSVAYGKHSLTYLGPVIWSILDISIRSSESLDTFKKRIKLVNILKLAGHSHVQYCRHDTSGKILFTTCTSGQIVATREVVSTRQTELSSGKCIALVH